MNTWQMASGMAAWLKLFATRTCQLQTLDAGKEGEPQYQRETLPLPLCAESRARLGGGHEGQPLLRALLCRP